MVVKDVAKQVIDNLPDEVSLEDIIQALNVRAKFDSGDRQIDEGRGVSHEEAKKRLAKWLK
jgi:hypothetical protein